MKTEPVLVWVTGGVSLLQAFMAMLIEFGVPITTGQSQTITAFAAVAIGIYVRSRVTPDANLLPGMADKIADAKAARS